VAGTSEILIQEELTARHREIVLRGAGLPLKGANFPGNQRVVTTWYPGNSSQATQHVIGPIERQSQWSGEWNTTRLLQQPCLFRDAGVETQIVIADDLRAVLEDLFRGGALLLVTWTTNPRESFTRTIVREGRCTDWNFAYDTIDDLKWTMTFDWVGRGKSQQKTLGADPNANAGLLQALQLAATEYTKNIDLGSALVSNKFNLPKSASRFTLGQHEALVTSPSRLMRQFAQAANLIVSRTKYLGDIIDKVRNLPFEIANQAVDVATNAIASANAFVDSMSRTPVEEMALQQNVAMVTRNASYYGDATRQAQYVSVEGVRTRSQFRSLAQGSTVATGEAGKGVPPINRSAGVGDVNRPLAIYLTREGDTLFSVSIKFYGSEAGMYAIAISNGFRASVTVLPVGRVLYIPSLPAAQAGAFQPALVPRPMTAPGTLQQSLPGGLTPSQGGGPSIVAPGSPLPGAP